MPHNSRCKSFLLLSLLFPMMAAARAEFPAVPAAEPAPPLQAALHAEFALQGGRLAEAARAYLGAAQQSGRDTRLSERAVRIAMLAGEQDVAEQALALWQAQSPHAAGARAARAALALRQGDVDSARPLLSGLLADPDPEAWRQAVGALITAAGNPPAVSAAVAALLDGGELPPRIEIWQELGRLLLRLDDRALVERMVPHAVRLFPEDPRVALLHAHQLEHSGQREAALAVLAALPPRVSADAALRNALAAQYDAMGHLAEAAQVLALGEQDVQSWGLRAALLVRQGDHAGLAALYEQLASDARRQADPGQRLLLGKLAQYLQRHEQALAWYRAVPAGPERDQAQLRIIGVHYQMGEPARALAAARALQEDVTLGLAMRAQPYLAEAELHRMDNARGEELQALNRGLAALPDDPDLLYARGLYHERVDDIARAEADLRALLLREPDSVAALNALGYTLADRTDRLEEALTLIDRARLAEPDNAAIIDSYGWVLYRLGQLEPALEQLQRAWSLQRDPEIGAHLAQVLLDLGREAQAREIYRQARELDPENRAVQALHDRLGQ